MIWESEELTPREEEFLRSLRRYAEDIKADYYDMGYDEGFEANEYQGDYERGYNRALENVMEMIEPSGLFPTPASTGEMRAILEMHHDKAVLVLKAYMNYLAEQIESMEQC